MDEYKSRHACCYCLWIVNDSLYFSLSSELLISWIAGAYALGIRHLICSFLCLLLEHKAC